MGVSGRTGRAVRQPARGPAARRLRLSAWLSTGPGSCGRRDNAVRHPEATPATFLTAGIVLMAVVNRSSDDLAYTLLTAGSFALPAAVARVGIVGR